MGYPSLARTFNAAMYDVLRRNVTRALRATEVMDARRVRDIGSGTGIWIDYWRDQGATEITGAELDRAATTRLRQRYPQCEFLEREVGDPDPGFASGDRRRVGDERVAAYHR